METPLGTETAGRSLLPKLRDVFPSVDVANQEKKNLWVCMTPVSRAVWPANMWIFSDRRTVNILNLIKGEFKKLQYFCKPLVSRGAQEK